MADTNLYRIGASPQLRTVTPGAVITYSALQNYDTISAAGGPRDSFTWYYYPDNDRQQFRRAAFGWQWKDQEWEDPGRYTVVLHVRFRDKTEHFYTYPQHVEDTEVVLARELGKAKKDGPADPLAAMNVVWRYVQVLRDVEKKHPITDYNKKREHDQLVAGYQAYADKLAELIRNYWSPDLYPIDAVHLETASQRVSRLNVFIARSMHDPSGRTWHLVDWTNPTQRDRTGVYEVKADSPEKAIRELIEEWDDGNRYFDGHITYRVPAAACGKEISGSFETDGASFWDSVASFFEWVALGAAVVAGVVTLVAPVPGSRIVSAAIWTSIFSSTAAAVVNIGQRHEEGFGSWKDDAFDGLTIVGNLFAGAGTWVKGATVVARNAQGQVTRYVLIGQVGADAVQGVLIAADAVAQYDRIMSDPGLTPQQRTDRLLELFRSMALAGTMTYISVKSSKADLDNLNRAPRHLDGDQVRAPAEKLADLRDPSKVIDTTKPPVAEGHTQDGRVDTRVQETQRRTHRVADAARRAPSVYPEPPPPATRGMREIDDLIFAEKAREKGVYIIVRDGNADGVPYVGRDGYKAKPETLKAKTSDQPPTKGLASFHPEHERTIKLLAGEPPPMSVAELRANPDEFKRRYEYFKKHKLEEKGFTVAGPEEHFVVKDAQGNKFHGDYDLHGVYSKDGKLLDSTEIRGELNREFGTELILHGAHDEWPIRNKPAAGANRGPQPPCTVYTPDGKAHHLPDRAAMKRFYKEHGLDWNSAYGEFEREVGKIQ